MIRYDMIIPDDFTYLLCVIMRRLEPEGSDIDPNFFFNPGSGFADPQPLALTMIVFRRSGWCVATSITLSKWKDTNLSTVSGMNSSLISVHIA
jgi:hypothetical protein